ncbi:triacylglycerol lipase [Geitlerinema sp. PCC 9228]|uniref:esterase/lipase family protein n=1 Tax=Geitlerinema sp. PCC 9228 TaxID=111611 RepID=UPI0008F9BECE|nr:triacylglycerol lipase [Geitlerinema sp. PCC 9228]
MSSKHDRNPVLLVHGIDDTAAVFQTMSAYLQAQGWSTYSPSLTPNNGDAGLERLAQQVSSYIKTHFPQDQPIDIVGFSMGGIVSRYYIQYLGGIHRVQRLVTISSPHQGTWLAYLRQNQGAAQMRPNSEFLQALNQRMDMLKAIQFTSIWTPLDLTIIPANSSQMPLGEEVQIPVPLHPWMIRDRRSLQAVASALQVQPRSPHLQTEIC